MDSSSEEESEGEGVEPDSPYCDRSQLPAQPASPATPDKGIAPSSSPADPQPGPSGYVPPPTPAAVSSEDEDAALNEEVAQQAQPQGGKRKRSKDKTPCTQEGCTAVFVRKVDLQDHLYIVHQAVPQPTCSRCGKKYQRKRALDRHFAEKHDGFFTYTCKESPTCSFKVESRAKLVRHLQDKHGSGREFTCPECHKVCIT